MHLTNHLLTKANVDKQDEKGNTILHYAIQNNRHDMAEMLLNWGAKPDVANKNGMTVLNIASLHKYSDCMKLLLKNNAEITKPDLYYAKGDIQSLYTLLANKQVHLSPEINTNLKELSNNVNSLFKAINYHFCNNISNPLYDDVPNNDIILSGTTEENNIF